ncbi:diaminopimelate decarboxylase, partial [Brenneria populi subsp. brevivirga]|nr:diaminopimelate decarboxylase [Brenneria populi subsp. brevivirga]
MWTIKTTDIFDGWFSSLSTTDRTRVLAALIVLRQKG